MTVPAPSPKPGGVVKVLLYNLSTKNTINMLRVYLIYALRLRLIPVTKSFESKTFSSSHVHEKIVLFHFYVFTATKFSLPESFWLCWITTTTCIETLLALGMGSRFSNASIARGQEIGELKLLKRKRRFHTGLFLVRPF